MGVLVRLIADYGFRLAVIVLAIGVSYVIFRYLLPARIGKSSGTQQSDKKSGPVEAEVCSRCAGPLDDNLTCVYCGTRHR